MNNHRLEINDLIDSAVNNAVARRNEALASVSDEEAKNVSGGMNRKSKGRGEGILIPIIAGMLPLPTWMGMKTAGPTKRRA
ncbi:hypothetical protein [Dolichospermum planctonicum]|uniref:Uncharacterized protein n=1 Tax=Dolichospermum planctonicum TaxID=136072 RepID=A0A480AB68_9CYAN|nr:hypothetical protein [Dolichospermum planctonicum]GCL40411.1 hypothetical protein NIES80_00960 [Dolichospermum planctonicum]